MPAGGTSAYTDSGLSASTAYDYRLRATNGGGESDWSNTATGTTDAPPPVTITLTATGSVKRGNHEVKLRWSGAGVSSVDIVRNGVVIDTTANNGRYTDKTGNSGSATYTYAVCEAGSSTCSDEETLVF